ncbi:lasso peptide biosynthesis B2 protein [Phenylobacterium zucineum]|uniref:lasso peptide biosynthesis B2 protein n=1 Tax=Phenylobacterium zucineum TaxID=284016 RepID=UPI0011D0DFE3|nr:lasso peptide biosynthesis B2 protein [Phenylobacterium zucineum]
MHAALVGEDLVFLDIGADAYSCLPGAGGAVELRANGALVVRDPSVADQMRMAGWLGHRDAAPAARAAAPRVRTTLLPHSPPPARARHAAEVLAVTVDVLRRYRGRSFAEILAAAGPAPPPPDRPPSEDLTRLVADFHGWIPYAPIPGKCLVRSFVLRRWLRRHGHDAQWVFGVATWPFRAHCWLQWGDVALDDVPERLQAFEPILVT